jgi:hypothetical protein
VAFADAKAVSANNRFFIIGGTENNLPITTVRIYSPNNQNEPNATWSEPLDFFEAKEIIGAQMLGDSIVVFSRIDEENLLISYYSSQNETWSHSAEKTTKKQIDNPSLTNISGSVFFIGGRLKNGELSNQFISYQAFFTIMLPAIVN